MTSWKLRGNPLGLSSGDEGNMQVYKTRLWHTRPHLVNNFSCVNILPELYLDLTDTFFECSPGLKAKKGSVQNELRVGNLPFRYSGTLCMGPWLICFTLDLLSTNESRMSYHCASHIGPRPFVFFCSTQRITGCSLDYVKMPSIEWLVF